MSFGGLADRTGRGWGKTRGWVRNVVRGSGNGDGGRKAFGISNSGGRSIANIFELQKFRVGGAGDLELRNELLNSA